MKIHDTLFGLFFLALGALVLFAVRGFPNIPGQPVGPALFPGLIAIGLCVTGILLVIKGLRHRASAAWFEWEDWVHSPRHVLALFVLLGCVVFYIAFANALDFSAPVSSCWSLCSRPCGSIGVELSLWP
jgi:putative tricarboxylic transport membrane protein